MSDAIQKSPSPLPCGISREDVIDAIGSLELRADACRDRAGWLPAGRRLEESKRAKHYREVAARFASLLQPHPSHGEQK